MELELKDSELIEQAKETRRTLYHAGRHEVASALRTHSGEVFAGIHIEANVGFADVCGEVAAICHAVAHGHGDLETTARYIHLSQEHLHTAANPLAKLKLSEVKESNPGVKSKEQG